MPRTAQFNKQARTALAAKQHGVIAYEQAVECGMTNRVMYYRVRGAGPWQVLVGATMTKECDGWRNHDNAPGPGSLKGDWCD
jgi:hypothetical protein